MKDRDQRESRLLLVDDSESIVIVIGDYLQDMGYSVDCAMDGKTAVDLINERYYDLLILDVNLPGLSGPEVAREAGKCDLPPAVIFITGQEAPEQAVDLFRQGAADYLVKPVPPRRMERAVAAALRQRDLQIKKEMLIKRLKLQCSRLKERKREQLAIISALEVLESGTGRKADLQAREAELTEKLESMLAEKKSQLKSIRDAELREAKDTESKLKRLDDAYRVFYPATLLSALRIVFIVFAAGFFIVGIVGPSVLLPPAQLIALKQSLMGQAFLVGIVFMEAVLFVQLYVLLAYTRLSVEQDDQTDSPPFVVVLKTTMGLAAVTGGFLILLVLFLVSSVMAEKAGTGGAVAGFLMIAPLKNGVSLALVAASVSFAIGAIAATFLLSRNYRRSIETLVQRSATLHRLEHI